MNAESVLDVRDLKVHFSAGRGLFSRGSADVHRVVDGISFALSAGGTFGVVGDTGAGKTVLLKALVGLLEPTGGTVTVAGKEVGHKEMRQRAYRRRVQIVLQNPYTSLPPRRTVRDVLLEPLRIHGIGSEAEREGRVLETLELVGLTRGSLDLVTGQLSGGQRQRVNVCRALMLRPTILLCDEPVSALDVSIKAQVLNLFRDLREELGLAYVFVAHDLSAVRYICDRIAVMASGRFVEVASNKELYRNPIHPYTRALLGAVPTVAKGLAGIRFAARSDRHSMPDPVPFCARYDDCPLGPERCCDEPPDLVEVTDGHYVTRHEAHA